MFKTKLAKAVVLLPIWSIAIHASALNGPGGDITLANGTRQKGKFLNNTLVEGMKISIDGRVEIGNFEDEQLDKTHAYYTAYRNSFQEDIQMTYKPDGEGQQPIINEELYAMIIDGTLRIDEKMKEYILSSLPWTTYRGDPKRYNVPFFSETYKKISLDTLGVIDKIRQSVGNPFMLPTGLQKPVLYGKFNNYLMYGQNCLQEYKDEKRIYGQFKGGVLHGNGIITSPKQDQHDFFTGRPSIGIDAAGSFIAGKLDKTKPHYVSTPTLEDAKIPHPTAYNSLIELLESENSGFTSEEKNAFISEYANRLYEDDYESLKIVRDTTGKISTISRNPNRPTTYEGEFHGFGSIGILHGPGTVTSISGKCSGLFKDGLLCGNNCRLSLAKGITYMGQFNQGVPHGYCIMVTSYAISGERIPGKYWLQFNQYEIGKKVKSIHNSDFCSISGLVQYVTKMNQDYQQGGDNLQYGNEMLNMLQNASGILQEIEEATKSN
jgi:hypothetical protein